jgi:eukaryotic-like serine/threonine-protein kinase
MSLTSGARLGPYELTGSLGAGGMGEVYRARDTRLNRAVALKVLPDLFANDAERLARFEREAQVLASLNHPHIAQIYGLEESHPSTGSGQGAVRALIMELVEGETLADVMSRGPVPIDQVLPIARQIAYALEAAHEAGIVHRDLKPANVKVRPDGTVKVLDFGLAKALDPVATSTGVGVQNSPTVTSPMMTGRGIILGTAAYMAPEQARGRAVDKRADIWAFGVILYEMLTGKRAFEGDDPSDVLAAVLRQEIDWAKLPASTPPSIRRLLERCLERDPRHRLRDIGDARIEIDDALKPPRIDERGVTGRPSGGRGTLAAAAIGSAVVAAFLGVVVARRLATPPQLPLMRFSLTAPPGQLFRGLGRALDISPDGTQIAFATNDGIYLRSLSNLETRQISSGFQTGLNPTFSPDGQTVALWWPREQAIKGTSLTRAGAFTLGSASREVGGLFTGMSWGPRGIVAGHGRAGVFMYPASGGPPEQIVRLAEGDTGASSPQVLPDGEHVLFTVTSASGQANLGHVVVESLKTHARRLLIERGSCARYLPTGHLVYSLDGILYAIRFDIGRLVTIGPPVRMVEGVRNLSIADAQFSVSDAGTLIYVPGTSSTATSRMDLAIIDRKGAITPANVPPGAYEAARVSPDGRRVAFGSDDGKDAIIWIYDLSGSSAPRRLTFGGRNKFPAWSPDGERVAFQSDRDGDAGLYWQRVDGGRAERLTKADAGTSHTPESWSSANGVLLFTVTKGAVVSLWTLSTRDGKREPFGGVESLTPTGAVFSPDGRWVAYATTEAGSAFSTVYVQPFPPTGASYQVSRDDDGHHPVWSRDGKELSYVPGPGRLAVTRVTTQPGFAVTPPTLLPSAGIQGPPRVVRNHDIMPDGSRFVGFTTAADDQSQATSGLQLHVVLNWFTELKQRVPTR